MLPASLEPPASKTILPCRKYGVAAAQESLGFMYINGDGVPQEHVTANAWFNFAAAQ